MVGAVGLRGWYLDQSCLSRNSPSYQRPLRSFNSRFVPTNLDCRIISISRRTSLPVVLAGFSPDPVQSGGNFGGHRAVEDVNSNDGVSPGSFVLGIAAALLRTLVRLKEGIASVLAYKPTDEEAQALNTTIRKSWKQMRTLAVVAPFAAVSKGGGQTTMLLLTAAVASFIKLYLLLLFLRVLLGWFTAFNWERQPWLALRQMTDPYLNLFRGLVPPLLGTIDFTPLLGFLILQFLQGALENAASGDDPEAVYW
eukprot:jgi/Botrbrau1/18729/Bobra.0386s0052.1